MTRAVLLLGLLAGPALAAPFQLARTLPHPAAVAGDFFGAALALADGRLAVGAPRRDATDAADAGAVYVFDAATGAWLATLGVPAPTADARLGSSLAASGTRLLAGAPHQGGGAPHAGAVHRFDLAGATWTRELPNPAPALDDGFGTAVAWSDDAVAVGARLDAAGGTEPTGAGWLLDADGSARWSLVATGAAPYDLAGTSIAAGAGVVAVGAPSDDAAGAGAGAVHVFDAGTGAWLRTLRPPLPATGDAFGRALALAGTQLLVGAPLDDVEGVAHAGAVYVFDVATGVQTGWCPSPTPAAGDQFGAAVAWRGGDLVVGAPFVDAGGLADVGAAWVLAPDCTVLGTLANPTPATDDQFGTAVTADDAVTVAVGAWHDDGGARDAGAVAVFVDAGGPPTTTTTGGPTTTTTTTSTTRPPTTTTAPAATSTTTTSTTATDPTSSTTTTAPAASTTTTTTSPDVASLPTSTTTSTTLPAPACVVADALACDDGDACTLDACGADGRCTHAAAVGLDGVTCRIDAMASRLEAAGPLAAGSRGRTRRLARLLAVGRRLVQRSHGATGRLRRAAAVTARFDAGVARAASSGRMRGDLADTLRAAAHDVVVRLGAVAG